MTTEKQILANDPYIHAREVRMNHLEKEEQRGHMPTTKVTVVPLSSMMAQKDSFTICIKTAKGAINFVNIAVDPKKGGITRIESVSMHRAGFLHGMPACNRHAKLNPELSANDVYEIITLADV